MSTQQRGDMGQPIQDFSDCHVGIVGTLAELASLARPQHASSDRSGTAHRVLAFFHDVVSAHHQEEERELFVAVLADAASGAEQADVAALVHRLTDEHRRLGLLPVSLTPT